MRGKHLFFFICLSVVSIALGIIFGKYINGNEFDSLVTFLSIIIGFEITSLSILFNNPLKRTLYDRQIKYYRTELHRLRDLYRFSIYLSLFYIVVIFIVPNFSCDIKYLGNIDKNVIILPILITSIYCIIVLCKDLFNIFVYPTNDR